MVRTRRAVPANPPGQDLAAMVANLQRQLQEQQQETNRLRDQLVQLNQRPQANEVPLRENQVPPAVPRVPEVRPKILRNAEVPLAPAEEQMNPPMVREDLLYERF